MEFALHKQLHMVLFHKGRGLTGEFGMVETAAVQENARQYLVSLEDGQLEEK